MLASKVAHPCHAPFKPYRDTPVQTWTAFIDISWPSMPIESQCHRSIPCGFWLGADQVFILKLPAACQVCSFAGHYIVLCGYSSDTEHYILRDPDPRTAYLGLCSVAASVLDRARKAFGTDEDLLIISLPRAAM